MPNLKKVNVIKKIMIDARVVEENYTHGIACYTFEIIKHLILKLNKRECEYFILIHPHSCLNEFVVPHNIKFIPMKTSWTSLLGQLELMWIIFKYSPTVFHAPSFIVPLLSRIKLIATVHDMNHVALARNYSLKQKIYYALLARRLKKNSIVLTVSEFSKAEITKYMPINPTNVHVVYNGISSVFKPRHLWNLDELQNVRDKYNLPANYIFTVGNHKPHKNLDALVTAYCQGNFQIPLCVLSDSYESLEKIVNFYQKSSQVFFLNRVEKQEELAHVYAMCECFVFPSLYEGFGLPPLEAAASGVCVVTSNVTSLPEVMGESALYFDPASIESMKKSLTDFLTLSKENRTILEKTGLTQASKFDWKITAALTVEWY